MSLLLLSTADISQQFNKEQQNHIHIDTLAYQVVNVVSPDATRPLNAVIIIVMRLRVNSFGCCYCQNCCLRYFDVCARKCECNCFCECVCESVCVLFALRPHSFNARERQSNQSVTQLGSAVNRLLLVKVCYMPRIIPA